MDLVQIMTTLVLAWIPNLWGHLYQQSMQLSFYFKTLFYNILEVPSSNYCCRQKGSLTDNNIGQVFSGVTHNSTRWEHEKAKIVGFESNVQLFLCLFIKCQLLSNTIKQISIICFLRVYLFTLLCCKC